MLDMPVISSLARYNLIMHGCYLYPVITRGGGLKLAVFFTIKLDGFVPTSPHLKWNDFTFTFASNVLNDVFDKVMRIIIYFDDFHDVISPALKCDPKFSSS